MWGVKKYIRPLPIRFIILVFFLIIIISIIFFKSKEKFLITSGGIITVAGNGGAGFSGDDGLATNATLNFCSTRNVSPGGLAVDSTGNIYIADTYNNRIRKVDTSGIITTIAGTGTITSTQNPLGDNGIATSATLNAPQGIAVDSTGNIYIADYGNNRIRKVDAITKIISTVAGGGTLFTADGLATLVRVYTPMGLALDSAGNIYYADGSNRLIKKLTLQPGTNPPTYILSTIAGGGTVTTNGGLATLARLIYPMGLAVDSSNNIYIADANDNRIRKLTLQTNNTYIISTVAGGGTVATDDGLATLARIVNPQGVAIDSTGNIYIAAANNARIMKVDTTGIITTVGGSNSYNAYSGIPSDDNNNPTKDNVRLKPTGITIDSFGNIYVADCLDYIYNRVRKIYK